MSHPSRLTASLLAGTGAGLVWGLAFLVPALLPGWSAVAVTAGRYLAYGMLSLALFACQGRAAWRLARQHWRAALAFAVTGNAGYYLLLVIGIQKIGAPVTDTIIGSIPVVVAVAGNWRAPSLPWRCGPGTPWPTPGSSPTALQSRRAHGLVSWASPRSPSPSAPSCRSPSWAARAGQPSAAPTPQCSSPALPCSASLSRGAGPGCGTPPPPGCL